MVDDMVSDVRFASLSPTLRAVCRLSSCQVVACMCGVVVVSFGAGARGRPPAARPKTLVPPLRGIFQPQNPFIVFLLLFYVLLR